MKVFCVPIVIVLILSKFSKINSSLDDTAKLVRDKHETFNSEDNIVRSFVKREAVPEIDSSQEWSPIRIQPIYFLSKRLLEEEKSALRRVLKNAILRIRSVLSVNTKDQKHLLLKRKHACSAVLKSGKNKGKCSKLQKGYTGEVCMDNFKIPSNHLEGLAIFNKSHPLPIKVYKKDGNGLNNTDFVLYVTSKTTFLCNPHKSSALAYASACQLGDMGRPVVGQVNFCPRILKSQKFDEELIYKTAIHELFHALGFSTKLFDRFVSCGKDGKCNLISHQVLQTVKGIPRLVTPAVVREMRSHFQCNNQLDFGGPLQIIDGKVSSHWNPILMHSSIMTAREQKPYVTLIDPITLAVFEDSGWYGVNYSQADPFIWGKGQGCDFGIEKNCDAHKVLCSDNSTGCHHLRLSKAKCNANPDLESLQCGVFAADQKPCFRETLKSEGFEIDSTETFSEISRCFISSLVRHNSSQNIDGKMTGKCYESKCDGKDVFVRIANGEWLPCPSGSEIQIENFHGSIECPSHMELCTSFVLHDLPISASVTTSNTDVVEINQYSEEGSYFNYPKTTTESDVERNYLFADVRISSINNAESHNAKSVILDTLKEYEIYVKEISSLTGKDDVRLCFILSVRVNSGIDRFMLKDLFKNTLSSAFKGRFDHHLKIVVLTSSLSFCRGKYRHLDKYQNWKGTGAFIDKLSLFKVIILQIFWFSPLFLN